MAEKKALEPDQPIGATDKAIPGGCYIVNNEVVDANGKFILGYVVVDGQAVKKVEVKEEKQ